jgi:hypothetical protein
MSSRDLFNLDEGDTGESILKAYNDADERQNTALVETLAAFHAKVNGKVDHPTASAEAIPVSKEQLDRLDQLPDEPTPALIELVKVNGGSAEWLPEGGEPVWGDVRHHRERIDQLNSWVRYWATRARAAERDLRIARGAES